MSTKKPTQGDINRTAALLALSWVMKNTPSEGERFLEFLQKHGDLLAAQKHQVTERQPDPAAESGKESER